MAMHRRYDLSSLSGESIGRCLLNVKKEIQRGKDRAVRYLSCFDTFSSLGELKLGIVYKILQFFFRIYVLNSVRISHGDRNKCKSYARTAVLIFSDEYQN